MFQAWNIPIFAKVRESPVEHSVRNAPGLDHVQAREDRKADPVRMDEVRERQPEQNDEAGEGQHGAIEGHGIISFRYQTAALAVAKPTQSTS